jgi:hypothetical protein
LLGGKSRHGGTLLPLEVNSSGSTFTPGRDLIVLGLPMDFLQVNHLLTSLFY